MLPIFQETFADSLYSGEIDMILLVVGVVAEKNVPLPVGLEFEGFGVDGPIEDRPFHVTFGGLCGWRPRRGLAFRMLYEQ